MIVRILGDARYDVPQSQVAALEQCDAALTKALDDGDEAVFSASLAELVDQVRRSGTVVDPGDMRSSELVVPNEGSSLAEVNEILASEGGS
jgi:hypothetical protein